jgi:hypothetical protein
VPHRCEALSEMWNMCQTCIPLVVGIWESLPASLSRHIW